MRYSLSKPTGVVPYDYLNGWTYCVWEVNHPHMDKDKKVGVVTDAVYHRFIRPCRKRILGWDIVSYDPPTGFPELRITLDEFRIATQLLGLGFEYLPTSLTGVGKIVLDLGCGYEDRVRLETALRLALPYKDTWWMR